MDNIRKLFGYKIKYLGVTNTKGARVSITDLTSNKRITIPFYYSYSHIVDIAVNKVFKGCNIIGYIENIDSYTIILDEYKEIK